MTAIERVAPALIVASVLPLACGSFGGTRDTSLAKRGPAELSLKDEGSIDVLACAGACALPGDGGRKS
jgi:hypothetical protein